MFGHRYFGAAYFGPRYFGPGVAVAAESPTGGWRWRTLPLDEIPEAVEEIFLEVEAPVSQRRRPRVASPRTRRAWARWIRLRQEQRARGLAVPTVTLKFPKRSVPVEEFPTVDDVIARWQQEREEQMLLLAAIELLDDDE